jgi:hypothetical protein
VEDQLKVKKMKRYGVIKNLLIDSGATKNFVDEQEAK